MLLLLDPPLAHAQLARSSQQPTGQRCTGAKEDADETKQIAEQLNDASQGAPEAQEEAEDSIHAALIAEEASEGNLP